MDTIHRLKPQPGRTFMWLPGATFEVSLQAARPKTQRLHALQVAKLCGNLSATWWSLYTTMPIYNTLVR